MGRILAAGPFPEVRRASPAGARPADHGPAALFPALVNAHTHLELSGLKGRIPFPQPGFPQWIELLFSLRAAMAEDYTDESLRLGLAELLAGGTALCADITNGGTVENKVSAPAVALRPAPEAAGNLAVALPPDGPAVHPGCGSATWRPHRPERQIFIELLGFNLDSISAAMPPGVDLTGANAAFSALVPHSVYSVSPAIIAESKKWTRDRGLPFSIHVAEHREEIEFLRTGKGFCRELLDSLGRWDPRWTPPGKTPVEYLDGLGALDSETLLVHAVHMTRSDWAVVAKRDCTAVFCPRSNRNLGSGVPQIDLALSLGIKCALGTDSLASNTDLNLFAEAAFTLASHPSIDPQRVIEMITINPARALGRKGGPGSIEPGAEAHILAVAVPSGVEESNLCEALVQSGKEGTWTWIN
jgi:cytosine/adenosine deaminase-related metal-dependent hydrolase